MFETYWKPIADAIRDPRPGPMSEAYRRQELSSDDLLVIKSRLDQVIDRLDKIYDLMKTRLGGSNGGSSRS